MKVYVKPFLHPIFKGTYEILSKFADVNEINFDFSRPKVYESSLRKLYRAILQRTPIPKLDYYFEAKYYDLIYSPQSIIPLNRKKFIIEIESLEMLLRKVPSIRHTKPMKHITKKLLFRSDLIKILTYTNATKESILWYFKDIKNIEQFVETSYPVIPENYKKYKKERNETPVIGYACSKGMFYYKGGKIVIDTICRLNRYEDFKFLIKADVPKVFIKKMEKYGVNFKVIPRVNDMFKEFYSKIDLFLYPSIMDTFGYVMLEAKSMGIPIVACDYFSTKEVVRNGGMVVPFKYRDLVFDDHYIVKNPPMFKKDVLKKLILGYEELYTDFINAIRKLLNDSNFYEECSKNNKKDVSQGVFSYKHKEKQIKNLLEGITF